MQKNEILARALAKQYNIGCFSTIIKFTNSEPGSLMYDKHRETMTKHAEDNWKNFINEADIILIQLNNQDSISKFKHLEMELSNFTDRPELFDKFADSQIEDFIDTFSIDIETVGKELMDKTIKQLFPLPDEYLSKLIFSSGFIQKMINWISLNRKKNE